MQEINSILHKKNISETLPARCPLPCLTQLHKNIACGQESRAGKLIRDFFRTYPARHVKTPWFVTVKDKDRERTPSNQRGGRSFSVK